MRAPLVHAKVKENRHDPDNERYKREQDVPCAHVGGAVVEHEEEKEEKRVRLEPHDIPH